jgi:hypothetical protein
MEGFDTLVSPIRMFQVNSMDLDPVSVSHGGGASRWDRTKPLRIRVVDRVCQFRNFAWPQNRSYF